MVDIDPTAGLTEPELQSENEGGGVAVELAPPAENGASAEVEEQIAAEIATALAPTITEPTETGDIDISTLGGLGAIPIPKIPLPIVKRKVTGRYRSTGTPFQVELRVDIDGPRPTMRVSADYYSVSGATVSYFGSMRVDAISVSVTPTLITITGLGTYTWSAGAPRVKITIPRVPIISPQAPATLQHLTTSGSPGAMYICKYASAYLRSVQFEQDRQDTVPTVFSSYNTGSLPSGGPARTLSVAGAYAEARIEMQTAGVTDVVNTSETGANGTWSDAELHAAMVKHFSLWRDVPQWAVWLFHAQLHDLGTGLLGIMFDQTGKQRQGAAVFYAGLAGATADKQRLQLYTCTHELGHCFNLLHSWQKSLATPPVPDRPNSLSWMNYPWRYPLGGPGAFWNAFAFQFDDQELIHIRHAFRDAVIMGGNPFAVGSALEDPEGWRDPIEDRSGLKLELRGPKSFVYGSPVSVDLELSATDSQGRRVPQRLRPRNGNVEIAIRQPSGRVVVYKPLIHQCAIDDFVVLDADTPGIKETAFIHYGQDGFYFDTPGFYRLRARTVAADGSVVLSNLCDVRVQSPVTREDEEAAGLVFGDEQGTLMYLMGSDFDGLSSGNEALTEVQERYPKHPLAAVAKLVRGVNAAREFKNVGADNTVTVRPADREEADKLLTGVIDVAGVRKAAAKKEDLDSIRKAAATQIRDAATTAKVGSDLAAFIKARRREIAVEVSGATD
jgi:hypothetical protein